MAVSMKMAIFWTVQPRRQPSSGSIMLYTTATVLFFAGSISELGSFIFAPAYTKDHRYPTLDSHSSNVLYQRNVLFE